MLVQILIFSKKGKNEYISGNVIDDPPFFFAVLWPQEVAVLLHIEFWAVFFKILWLLNLWVSGIFFPKENELVLFIAPRHFVGRVRKQKPVDAPLQGLSRSPALTSWIATHQKLPLPPMVIIPQKKIGGHLWFLRKCLFFSFSEKTSIWTSVSPI